VQIALAALDLSNEELRAAMDDDRVALEPAFEELTGHAEFLDDAASLLKRAQARLRIVAAAPVYPLAT